MITQPLAVLASSIRGHVKAGEKATEHFKAAGLYLIEARDRIQAGETAEFPNFSFFCDRACFVAKSRAYELIAIAEGTKTLDEVREATAERMRRHREEQRPSRGGQQDKPRAAQGNLGTTSKTSAKGGRPRKPETPEAALIKAINTHLRDMDVAGLRCLLLTLKGQGQAVHDPSRVLLQAA